MKSYRAKTFLRLMAIIACTALVSCAADAPVDDTIHTPEHDTTQSQDDTRSEDATRPEKDTSDPEDTSSTSDISDTEDAISADTNPSDTAPPDADEVDADEVDADEVDASPDSTDEDTSPGIADGKTCDTAIDITAGGLWDNQTTVGANNDYNAPHGAVGCPGAPYTGDDQVFVLAPQTTTTYNLTITSQDAAFRPVVYIRADCTQTECIAGSMLDPTVIYLNGIEVPGGERYYVIVDTHTTSREGAFSLSVETP